MEGLLLAHDRIASVTDRTPASFVHSSTDAFTNKIHNQSANIINNNVLKVSSIRMEDFNFMSDLL